MIINEEYMLEANYKHLAKTSIVSNKIYPVVAKSLPSTKSSIKRIIGEYITSRYKL